MDYCVCGGGGGGYIDTGELFRCYMLDQSICRVRVWSLFCFFSIFDGKSF